MTRRRKPAGTSKQQGSGGAKVLQLVPDNDAPAPPAPAGLSTKAVARWDAFWKSKLAGYVDVGSDLHRLERWIADVDEFDTLRAAYEQERIVKGSQGQPRLNPIATRLKDLERQIRDAEDQFGMTPAARPKLGISFGGNGPTTAEDLNRMIDQAGEDDGEGEVEDDVAAGFVEA